MFKKINKYQHGFSEIKGTDSWLYACDSLIDFYEVQELKNNKGKLLGNEISFFSYPQGHTYTPFQLQEGIYYCSPIFIDGIICFLKGDFRNNELSIIKYQPMIGSLSEVQSFDIKDINLYNIGLAKYPLMLVSEDEDFVCYYPERITIKLGGRDSFIIKADDVFYLNRWTEEGVDENHNLTSDYKYYESMVAVNHKGEVLSVEKGALSEMPNGELWIF